MLNKLLLKGFNLHFFELSDFDNIPELPGLYAWYPLCKREVLLDFHSIYKNKSYTVTLEGSLQEKIIGKAKSEEVDFKHLSYNNLFKAASFSFAPPIYVGKAETSLRQRLITHKRELQQILNDTKIKDKSTFAKRLSYLLKDDENSFNETHFFVKVLSVTNSEDKKAILEVENFFNRTFNPIMGCK